MKYLKILGLAAVAAMALTAFMGAGTASATQLYKYTTPSANDKLGVGTTILSSLESGTSALLKDTGGLANDTCTASEVHGTITKDTSSSPAVNPQGAITTLSFTGCSHTTNVLANGSLEIKNIAGTTNGTVISKEARVTIKSTVFGISCTANTGAGTTIGTLTGAKKTEAEAKEEEETEKVPTLHRATMDISAIISLENGCGDSTWTGSYVVTSPVGLTVEAS